MTDVEMETFDEGSDVRFLVTYYVPDTTTPQAPDATPTIDIQLDGTSLATFPVNMVSVAAHQFEYWWNSSGETRDVYEGITTGIFNTHDVVKKIKVQLK